MADIIAKMDSPAFLKSIFASLTYLIDETVIKFSPSGIEFGAIDSSHVAMLLSKIPKEFFNTYTFTVKPAVDKEKTEKKKGKSDDETKVATGFDINVNVHDTIKILQRAKATDCIELVHDDAIGHHILVIKMMGEKSTRTFKIKGKESAEKDDVGAIAGNFANSLKDKITASFTFPVGMLDEIVKDALIMSDLIKVNVSKDGDAVFSASEDAGEVATEIDLKSKPGGEDIDWNPDIKDDAEGIYSLNFLENILKVQSIVDSITIFMGKSIPIRIVGTFKASDENPATGTIDYLLAPRVDEDNGEDIPDDMEEVSGDDTVTEESDEDEEDGG